MTNVSVTGKGSRIKIGLKLCILCSLAGGKVVSGCYAFGSVLSGFAEETFLSVGRDRSISSPDHSRELLSAVMQHGGKTPAKTGSPPDHSTNKGRDHRYNGTSDNGMPGKKHIR